MEHAVNKLLKKKIRNTKFWTKTAIEYEMLHLISTFSIWRINF